MNNRNRSPIFPQLSGSKGISSLALEVGFLLTMLALILELFLPRIHGAAVAVGVLYISASLRLFSHISREAVSATRTKRLLFLGALLKLPVLFFVLYLLSKMGTDYVLNALAGTFAFVPACVVLSERN